MANTILTPTAVTREALRILHQKSNFIGSINRQYDDSFANSGAKIGDSLKIRLPNQYTVSTGSVLQVQNTAEISTTLQIATQKHVDINFGAAELTLSLDDFSKRILDPAMSVLAANVEADAMNMYKDIYQMADNSGAAATLAKLLEGRKKLQDSLAPPGDRTASLNTQDNIRLVDALKALFHDSTAIKQQYKEGYMGRTAGFDFVENTLWPAHPRGAGDANYTASTLVGVMPISATPITALPVLSGTGALPLGEVFTIGNVFRVHPETKVSTGVLQQFVVTTAYAGGAGTIASISPSIILAGARQNVVIPTTSATAAITIAGTASTSYGTSMLYHKDAFTFATADLVMPKGVDFSARESQDGIALRVVRQYDINNDQFPCRIDILYGYKTIRAELACRYANHLTT